jgi:hypothetical protein
MGVVSIKPKHMKEILNLLSVLDRKTKEAEVVVFETEGAPYGAVNVTIFKDQTLDLGKVLITTPIPYHTLEGDLSVVFSVKAFKGIAGEAKTGSNAKNLLIEHNGAHYADIWFEGGAARTIQDLSLSPGCSLMLSMGREKLGGTSEGQEPVYVCEISPKEARTLDQCATVLKDIKEDHPHLALVAISAAPSSNLRIYGATDRNKLIRHTCRSPKGNSEHGEAIQLAIPTTAARLIKEMTPSRATKPKDSNPNSKLFIFEEPDYGLVETPKGTIRFTYVPKSSNIPEINALLGFVINPPRQTAFWGTVTVDGDKLIEALGKVEEHPIKHPGRKPCTVVKLHKGDGDTLTITTIQEGEVGDYYPASQTHLEATWDSSSNILGTYDKKHLLDGLKALRKTAGSTLGAVHILGRDQYRSMPLYVFSEPEWKVLNAPHPDQPNLWNSFDTAASVAVLPVRI